MTGREDFPDFNNRDPELPYDPEAYPPGDDCGQNFPFSGDPGFPDRSPFGKSDYVVGRVSMDRQSMIADTIEGKKIDVIEMFRLRSASNIIRCSMFCLVLFVIVSIVTTYYKLEVKLLDNAFEAFKLIVMTAIGFLFGSKTDNISRNHE